MAAELEHKMLRMTHVSRRDEAGFTLVEMVTAIALTAFAFAGIAMMLLGAMRAISVQKARTQGNEVATQAIEDLQRLDYSGLYVCPTPTSAPTAFSDPVPPPSPCSGITPADPCVNPAGNGPAHAYTCRRYGIDYTVKRYVAFGDIPHTEKQLGVFVSWTDSGGPHEVSQQSSLRIPTKAVDIGAAPPTVDQSQTLTPTSVDLVDSGPPDQFRNIGTFVLQTKTTGLTTADSVIAVFTVLDGANAPEQTSVTLTTGNGSTWQYTVADRQFKFPRGDQWIVFTAVRSTDGKINSAVDTVPTRFETDSGAPRITATRLSATDLVIEPTGDLSSANPNLTIEVDTELASPEDTVSLLIPTRTGMVTVAMQSQEPPPACRAGNSVCDTTWAVTIENTDGHRFALSAAQPLYIAVNQRGPGGVHAFDIGATAALATQSINFHL